MLRKQFPLNIQMTAFDCHLILLSLLLMLHSKWWWNKNYILTLKIIPKRNERIKSFTRSVTNRELQLVVLNFFYTVAEPTNGPFRILSVTFFFLKVSLRRHFMSEKVMRLLFRCVCTDGISQRACTVRLAVKKCTALVYGAQIMWSFFFYFARCWAGKQAKSNSLFSLSM